MKLTNRPYIWMVGIQAFPIGPGRFFFVRTVSFREGSCLRSTPRKINIEPENDGFGMFGR